MSSEILSTLVCGGAALVPLVLAAIGIHLAAPAIADPVKKRRMVIGVWALAVFGAACAVGQQAAAYYSEELLQSKLDKSLADQEYTRGQLDSIALMVGHYGQTTRDAFALALGDAIEKVVQRMTPKHFERAVTESLPTTEGPSVIQGSVASPTIQSPSTKMPPTQQPGHKAYKVDVTDNVPTSSGAGAQQKK